MAITSRYPSTRPSTSVNLNRKKILIPGAKFSRSSVGTYVDENGLIKNAEYNEPRFNYDSETGEFLGLLVEEERTNYFPNSSLPTGAANGVKTTVSGYLLPDGTTGNCTQLYVDQVQNNLYDGFNGTVPGEKQFHFSFWIQNISGFDITFSYGRSDSFRSQITLPSDGKWHRLSRDVGVSSSAGQLYNLTYVDTRPAGSTYPVSTPFTVLLWGSQCEVGLYPTSYIPTSGSTVTREADTFELPIKTFKSGRIQYSSEIAGNSYYGNIALKDSINTPEYSLEIGSANSLPTISTKFSNVLQSTASLTKLPSTTTKEFSLSFNFDKDTGKIDFSTPVSDDADASVLELPSKSSRKIPSGYSIDTLEVLPGTNIKEVYLWNEELDVNELSSLSEDFASINTQVVETEGYSANRLDYEDLPSLDLNFARNKSLDDNLSGENLITFTRSSTATYVDANGVIQTAATDEPRFDHDPLTGESLGLLVEESRTNLAIWSEEFGNTGWLKNGGQITFSENVGVAPDGTFTADQVNKVPNLYSWCRPAVSISNSITYTFSLYVKPLTTNKNLEFEHTGAGTKTVFNLDTLTTSGAGTHQIIPISNGWYRIVWTFSGISGLGGFPQFPTLFIGPYPTSSDSVSFLFWGLQVEEGSFPTSYIPTSGSTVTRAADVAEITGSNFSSWYNQSEGTTLVHLKNIKSQNFSLAPFIAYDGNNNLWDNNQEYGLRYNSSGTTMEAVIRDSSAGFVSLNKGGDVRAETKAVIALNSTQFALTRDGLSVSTIATSGPISSITRLALSVNPGPRQSTHFSRLTYWPTRLPDTKLQEITSSTVDTFDLVFDSSLDASGIISIITTGNCTYEVDWGDGSAVETIVASGTFSADHTYIFPSKYIAKINVISGAFRLYYNNSSKADQLIEIKQTPGGWTNTSTSGFGTNLQGAWRGANNLEFIDNGLNISGVTSLDSAWRETGITSFPLLDTSTVTSASASWYGCSNLTSFPLIDTSNVTNFHTSWLGCNLLSFPKIDTSSAENVSYAWYGNANLVSFPQLDFSSVLNETSLYKGFSRSWMFCNNLENFPAGCFDNTAGTYFYQAFNATKLNAESVSNILSSINNANTSDGVLGIFGSGATTPAGNYDWNSAGWDGFNGLISRNWTIDYVDNLFSSTNTPLDLQFAATKTLDSRITFTRGSTGTYVDANGVIQTAAVDTARFDHDPVTGESLGLLVEEARTNDFLYSSNGGSLTTANTTTKIPNAVLAPDGSLTAIKVTENTASSRHYVLGGGNQASNTRSVYAKAGERRRIFLSDSNISWATFDLILGTIISSVNCTAQIVNAGNGWYRCSISHTSFNGVCWWGLNTDTGTSFEFYQGDGVSGVYFWGFQTEVGSFPTSYIPTPATFTSRSTTATYYDANGVIQTAGVDVARDNAYFPDENGTFYPAGLLLEEAATNLIIRSLFTGTSLWTLQAISILSTNHPAPDNTNTAVKIGNATSTATNSVIWYQYNGVGTTHTFTFYAKGTTTGQKAYIQYYDNGTNQGSATIDLDNGTVTIVSMQGDAVVRPPQNIGNGWFRCQITCTPAGGTNWGWRVGNYLTGDIYVWGAQLEEGSFPTSYIPTAGSTVTRAADVSSSSTVTRSADIVTIEGTNFSSWYNPNSGTYYAHTNKVNAKYGHAVFGTYKTSAGNSQIDVITADGNNTIQYFTAGGPTSLYATPTGFDNTTKLAASYDSTLKSLAADGNNVISTTGTTPDRELLTRISIGNRVGIQQLNGRISRLTYWPKRLPDGALKYITQ